MLPFLTVLAEALIPDMHLPAERLSCDWRAGVASMGAPAIPAMLTREDGKNGKLAKLLDAAGVPCEELPCIAFERLDGRFELQSELQAAHIGWCVITSPESATVFLDSWRSSGSPAVRIASVGAGTAKVLKDAGIPPVFIPSKATAKTLASELPGDGPMQVLYPASKIASSTIEEGLRARGMAVRRLDTYTTIPAHWDSADSERAAAAQLVTFASPSAVRVWAERVGTTAVAVCIGETSATEASRVGFADVRFPSSPGVASWAVEVVAAWQTIYSRSS